MTNRFLCILCATLVLAGCSYFDKAEPVDVEQPEQPTQYDLTQSEEDRGRIEDLYNAQYNEEARGDVLAHNLSGQGVEVYSLDGGVPQNIPPSDLVASSFNSNVEVFPLDAGMRDLTAPRNLPRESNEAAYGPGAVPVGLVDRVSGANAVVYFDHGETTLDQEDSSVISAVSNGFRTLQGGRLSVEGYASSRAVVTDPVARKIANLKTSMNRALSVVRGLVETGVPAESIRTVAWGEEHQGADDEATARRVEIIAQ